MNFIWERLKSRGMSFFQWFEPSGLHEYPNDEVNLLIKRFMANRSWFDSISADWTEKPFTSKIANIGGAMLIAGLVGLWVNAVLLSILVTSILVFSLHSLLIAHWSHRTHSALIFAAETEALAANFAISQECFDDAARALSCIQNTIKPPIATLNNTSMRLDAVGLSMQRQHEALAPVVDGITTETSTLMTQQKAAIKGLGAMSDNINTYNGVLEQSMTHTQTIDDAIKGFFSASQAFKASQDRFSQAVNNFCMFKPMTSSNNVCTTDPFHAQLAEDEALIARWTKRCPTLLI